MQETMQEAYVELVSLLKDQLARKDERIAMLEAQLEEANRRVGRPARSAEESVDRAARRDAPEAEAPLEPLAPLKLPDLGPPHTAIAQLVMEAAQTPVAGAERDESFERTARMDREYLRRGHRRLQAGTGFPRRRPGVLLGLGALAAGGVALTPFYVRRTQTVERMSMDLPPAMTAARLTPARPESLPNATQPDDAPLATTSLPSVSESAIPPPTTNASNAMPPPAAAPPKQTERVTELAIAILPPEPKPSAPRILAQTRLGEPEKTVYSVTLRAAPPRPQPLRTTPSPSRAPVSVARREKPRHAAPAAVRMPPPQEEAQRAHRDPSTVHLPAGDDEEKFRWIEDLPDPKSGDTKSQPHSRYGISALEGKTPGAAEAGACAGAKEMGCMDDWPVLSRYDAARLREIAMPVGGIGTGFFALGGRGQLTDWQLMSRPHRGWRPMYAHLALRTKQATARGATVKLRILEGDITEGLAADFGAPPVLAGIPRMKAVGFEASYPFGRVRLEDRQTPAAVAVEAFNPLIPRDTDASSLPMGLLTITLTNRTAAPLEASVTLLLSNFVGTDGLKSDLKDNITERAEAGGWKGMRFAKTRADKTAQNGTMAILCDAPDVRVARRWPFRDRPWNGEPLGIIDSLLNAGFIADDEPERSCPPSPNDTWDSSLSALVALGPGEARSVRFLVTWRFPYRNLAEEGWWSGGEGDDPALQNHYAAPFADALEVAQKVIPRLDDLRARTVAFVRSVVERAAPQPLKEAALFNLTALRSHTCFRLGDGTFVAFEGCGGSSGCCIGSCTHVWNYEQATLSLFPDLHRSMLESHLTYGVTARGAQRFRLSLPVQNPTWNGAAADGQMGLIVRAYQQYLADSDAGGLDWLKRQYPTVKALLAFAWEPGGWDADRDGVMEGTQHNTYDVEFFGPNPICTVWYLAALAATEKMAVLVGDTDFALTCKSLREKGSDWVDRHLFNGRYYFQIVTPATGPVAPMTALGEEYRSPTPRFQVGQGCLIDQLVGQYRANRAGLGDLLDGLHLRTAAASIFRYNYRPDFRDHYNNMRTFATADESGTLICSYPDGGRPEVPFPYWGECMTGFEYQLAVLLLDYGFPKEAVRVAKAVRDRHNGAKRNPFNEPECGSYYARAMASWALLDAWDHSHRPAAS